MSDVKDFLDTLDEIDTIIKESEGKPPLITVDSFPGGLSQTDVSVRAKEEVAVIEEKLARSKSAIKKLNVPSELNDPVLDDLLADTDASQAVYNDVLGTTDSNQVLSEAELQNILETGPSATLGVALPAEIGIAIDTISYLNTQPMPIETIARHIRVNVKSIYPVINQLRKAGIVSSKKGPNGGTVLLKPLVTIADLYSIFYKISSIPSKVENRLPSEELAKHIMDCFGMMRVKK